MRWLTPLKYALVILTFVSAIHHSVFRLYFGAEPPRREHAGDSAWGAAYNHVLRLGHHVGYSTQWRMYTPVVRDIAVAEISARTGDGRWIDIPIPNLSVEHRERRSRRDAWLFDFKAAIIHYNYFVAASDPHALRAYLYHIVQRVRRDYGFEPTQIKVEVKRAPIPRPGEHDGFRPQAAVLETSEVYTLP